MFSARGLDPGCHQHCEDIPLVQSHVKISDIPRASATQSVIKGFCALCVPLITMSETRIVLLASLDGLLTLLINVLAAGHAKPGSTSI